MICKSKEVCWIYVEVAINALVGDVIEAEICDRSNGQVGRWRKVLELDESYLQKLSWWLRGEKERNEKQKEEKCKGNGKKIMIISRKQQLRGKSSMGKSWSKQNHNNRCMHLSLISVLFFL